MYRAVILIIRMIRHLILGYGRATEPQRILFCALSFWAWYKGDRAGAQTIIFTDQPEFFVKPLAGLPVECRNLTPELLAELRGPQKFAHRIKVAIIEQMCQDNPGDEVIYCDSDTFFVMPVAPLRETLRPGHSFMHVPEYALSEVMPIWTAFTPPHQEKNAKRFLDLIAQKTFAFNNETQKFDESQIMWNAGFIGLPAGAAPLMAGIMQLTDAFYDGSEWVMCEQVAFSLGLQTHTKLEARTEFLFHYWGQRQKVFMDGILANLLEHLPSTMTLDARLAVVRKLTSTWRKAVQADEARQTALLAFSNGALVTGVKQTVKVLLKSQLDTTFVKDALTTLRQRNEK